MFRHSRIVSSITSFQKLVGFENYLAEMIIMTRQCVVCKNHVARSKVKVTVHTQPGRIAQSVGYLTRKSGVLGSIPGLATYSRFSFRFFKKGSCQLLAKVCARSTC